MFKAGDKIGIVCCSNGQRCTYAEKIKDKHPIIGKVLEYRNLSKLLSTYLEGLNDYKIINGAYIQRPEEPVREGYQFIGWYYEGKEFDFNMPVTTDVELEARWKEIKNTLN